MNILFLSPHDNKGGASRIAWYLFNGFRGRGVNVHFIVGKKSLVDADITQLNHERYKTIRFFWRLKKAVHYFFGIENFNFPASKYLLAIAGNKPDLLHVHNFQGGYFDLTTLPILSQQLPILITLHDPWLFSGHCSYFIDCRKWETGCGNCPDLLRTPTVRRDATAYNWRRKQKIYQKSKIYIAAPSQWLIDEMKISMLNQSVVEARVIHNGVDTMYFKPANKDALKSELKIELNAFVLLYVVSSRMKDNAYKDYETINEAILVLSKKLAPHQKVVFIGLGEAGETEISNGVEKRFIPYLTDLTEIAKYYQVSDLYLHAARAENFPNVVLEALACGTPVIATKVGGVPEQIIDHITGRIVGYRNQNEMANVIFSLMENRDVLHLMSANAVKDVHARFTLQQMLDQYQTYYEHIIEDSIHTT